MWAVCLSCCRLRYRKVDFALLRVSVCICSARVRAVEPYAMRTLCVCIALRCGASLADLRGAYTVPHGSVIIRPVCACPALGVVCITHQATRPSACGPLPLQARAGPRTPRASKGTQCAVRPPKHRIIHPAGRNGSTAATSLNSSRWCRATTTHQAVAQQQQQQRVPGETRAWLRLRVPAVAQARQRLREDAG